MSVLMTVFKCMCLKILYDSSYLHVTVLLYIDPESFLVVMFNCLRQTILGCVSYGVSTMPNYTYLQYDYARDWTLYFACIDCL